MPLFIMMDMYIRLYKKPCCSRRTVTGRICL